jgi:hypothetical protein
MSERVPERAGREGDQPLPAEGKGDVVLELVTRQMARVRERREVGIKRYGHPLQRFNGRDVFRDIEDELFDAAAYLEQASGEVEALRQALLVLARQARGERVEPDLVAAALALTEKLEELHGRG